MKTILNATLAAAVLLAATQTAHGQATITAASTWTAGQPLTVTWRGTSTPVCNVRAALTINGSLIQMGSPVSITAGSVTIPAVTLTPGSTAVISLADQCVSKKIDSNSIAVRIVGTAVTPAPLTPTANTISAQVRQTIDTACQGILGAACSTSASYGGTYTAITQQIGAGKLGTDSSSIMTYLSTMVRGSTGWQSALISSAWSATRCSGVAPTAQWLPQYGSWTTYQQLYNQMAAKGCAGASGNTQTGIPAGSGQVLTAAQLTPAYLNVWGPAYKTTPMMTNCPVANGADSCARSALVSYVAAHGTSVLTLVAGYQYSVVTGSYLDSAHAQTIAANFGRTWTGADDLARYLQANPTLFASNQVFGGLDGQGCFVNTAHVKLAANESCGNYYVDANGAHAPGVYPASFKGAMVILTAANPGGGVLVGNTGNPLRVVETGSQWAIGNGIVAQGGGNIVAQGGGNIVAQGGGNIVAQGGGNIVAQGGGNIILQGGSTIVAQGGGNLTFTDASSAARAAGLLDTRGTSIISQDGNGFLSTMNQVPAIARLVGDNGGGLMTDNGAALQRGTLSVGGAQAATITGPSTWTYGQPVMIAWKPTPGVAGCASGYYVMINGTTTLGNPTAIVVGKSLLPANAWPRGTVSVSLYSPCTKAPATAPYTVRIQ